MSCLVCEYGNIDAHGNGSGEIFLSGRGRNLYGGDPFRCFGPFELSDSPLNGNGIGSSLLGQFEFHLGLLGDFALPRSINVAQEEMVVGIVSFRSDILPEIVQRRVPMLF